MSDDNNSKISSTATAADHDQSKMRVPFFRPKKAMGESIRRRNPDDDEEAEKQIQVLDKIKLYLN